ncbi:hypothetical protein Lser_V15G16679 [Lactuca serriola]
MIDCISRNKRPLHVPYLRWFGLILSREEGYVESHGIIIPIPALSSKIVNDAPSKDDFPITAWMQKWIENPYAIESSYSEEDNDNDDADDEEDNDDAGDEEYNDDGNDDHSEACNKEGVDKEEVTDKGEEDSTNDMDDHSPTPSPSPQADTVHQAERIPPTRSPIITDVLHQDHQEESSSNFETVRLMALDDDDDMVLDDTPPNSPGDISLPPPPLSTNIPPPPPPPFHPPPRILKGSSTNANAGGDYISA